MHNSSNQFELSENKSFQINECSFRVLLGNQGLPVGAVCLDLSKVFDGVLRTSVLDKRKDELTFKSPCVQGT